jgi:uncharacterized protein (TIGR03083 family)
MQLEQHLGGMADAVAAFATAVTAAGLDAPVPTTPDWDVRRLVLHQGLAHRWAAGQVSGNEVDPDVVEAEGRATDDPVAWLRDGAELLARTIRAAPDELEALVFLADAPTPKRFWARRQCHETTLRAVDALSAVLGRYPRAADTWIGTEVAVDGLDELLTGFLPRPRSGLRAEEPLTIAVLPDDAQEKWLVVVSRQAPITARGLGDEDADVVLRGSAAALYLTLWNRSDEVGDDALELWAESARVIRG